jgi:pSer/pThr/pTyr-binding forkhead associated (FHA) protein
VVAVFCSNCGHHNAEGVNFCSSCGNALLADGDHATITLHPTDDHGETTDEAPEVTLVEVPHGSGVLVVTRGPNSGARFLLGSDVVRAGRHPESDIFLDDITVSRRHVEVTPSGSGTFRLRDVGSLNGTYVNRERIDDVLLAPGDEVQIGKFKLVYLVAGNE